MSQGKMKRYLCVICEKELKMTPPLLFKDKTEIYFMCCDCNYAISISEIRRGIREHGVDYDIQEIG